MRTYLTQQIIDERMWEGPRIVAPDLDKAEFWAAMMGVDVVGFLTGEIPFNPEEDK